ncbi:MAG: hypothetical protein ACRDGS_08745, partial [Chloroflexota bacterium]
MIAEYVESRSQAVDDLELTRAASAGGDGWTAADLLDAVDRLCLLYSLPLLARDQGPVVAEARAFEAMGIAATAYLASAIACAIRVTSGGPAVAFGRWSGSVILSHLLAVIPAVPAEPELFLNAALGPTDLSPEWCLHPPLFLVAEDPDSSLLRLLGDDPLLSDPRITDSPGSFALRAAMGAPARLISLDGVGAATDISPAGTITVTLQPSRLLWVLREGLSLVERETGAMVRLGEEGTNWPVSGSVPRAGLFTDLPEIPAWAATPSAYGAIAQATVALWLSLAPSPPSPPSAAALRTRAYLAHALVA